MLHFAPEFTTVSSAIRWVARDRERGDLEPDKRGGNTRSHRIDAHRELIMSWIEEAPDLTRPRPPPSELVLTSQISEH